MNHNILHVSTPNWQNLSQIHRADLELLTETCHHVGFFRFDPKFRSTPRLGIILLGRILARINPSLQATCCHRGDASAQRAAPGRAEKIELALRRAPVRRKFRHLNVCKPCKFCAHEPILSGANSMSNKCSQTPRANHNHQYISKSKLTGGYRKRSSGSRAIKQNVNFPRIFC